jgi:uncharacterized protein (TIGR02996 family)
MKTHRAAQRLVELIGRNGAFAAAGWVKNRYRDNEITDAQLPQLYPYFDAEGQALLDERLRLLREEKERAAVVAAERKRVEEEIQQKFEALPNYKRSAIPSTLDSECGWRRRGLKIDSNPVARSGQTALYEKPSSYWRDNPVGFASRSSWQRKGREVIGQHQVWRQSYGKLPAYGLWSLEHTRPRTWRCKGLSEEERALLHAAEKEKQVYLVYADWLEERGRSIEATYYRATYGSLPGQ